MTATLYPIPTPTRRRIVRELGEIARQLDSEADRRRGMGQHDRVVRDELLRSAGSLRFVATLVVNGSMSTPKAQFWMVSARAYLALVNRADRRGVIR